jgi:hypothetical protein
MNVAQETLGLRRGSFSLPLSLLMSAFALLIPPENLTILLHRPTERSPTAHAFPLIHSAQGSLPFVKLRLRGWRQTSIKGEGACVPIAQDTGRLDLNELKWNARTRSFGVQFEPRYIFRAGRLDQ